MAVYIYACMGMRIFAYLCIFVLFLLCVYVFFLFFNASIAHVCICTPILKCMLGMPIRANQ